MRVMIESCLCSIWWQKSLQMWVQLLNTINCNKTWCCCDRIDLVQFLSAMHHWNSRYKQHSKSSLMQYIFQLHHHNTNNTNNSSWVEELDLKCILGDCGRLWAMIRNQFLVLLTFYTVTALNTALPPHHHQHFLKIDLSCCWSAFYRVLSSL